MTFLPIVDRELRVAARRGSTYWMRLGAALVGIVVGVWIWAMMARQSPKEMGLVIFVALSVFSSIYCLFAGMRNTADCLSEEKREGTLGLLFLTDLKGYDVVFGKLAATSLNSFYGLLAIFPVMGIPLLLGGVAPGEFWRVLLVCVNTLFFSLSIGMFCSSLCRDDRKAMLLALFFILLLTGVLPFVGFFLAEEFGLPSPPKICFIASPGYDCFMAFDASQNRSVGFNFFYESVLVVHLLSWAALLAACVIVPRTWQDKAASASKARRRERLESWEQGAAEVRTARRRLLLQINPFLWLTARDRWKGRLVWGLLLGGAAIWAWGWIKYPRDWPNPGCYVTTAILLHTILKNWLASEACRRFAADRQSGALELLLSTPIRVPEILHGQRLALLRQFGGPVVAVLVVDVLFLVAGLGEVRDDEGIWVLTWVLGAGVFVWDLFALSWVSMWMGLCSRSVNRAAGAALVRICVLPWLFFGLFFMCFAMLEIFVRPGYPHWLNEGMNKGLIPLAIWFGLSATANLFFAGWAKRKLLAEFRTVATSRFEAGPSGAWGRWLGELFAGKRR